MSQSKNWVFTLNNYTADEMSELEVTRPEVSYIVFAEEVGESGTPHLQGYVEFTKNMRMAGIKKLLVNPRLWLAVRLGTQEDAIAYCKKTGEKIYERGTPSATRAKKAPKEAKNKLLSMLPLLKSEGLQALSNDANCNMHMLKHAQIWLGINGSPRKLTTPLEVSWFWGETGTGKTYTAYMYSMNKYNEVPYIKTGNSKFFDGYNNQKVAIFDDLREKDMEFNYLLKLLDIYPMRVEIKGSTIQWKPEHIFITSPMCPRETFTQNSYNGCKDSIEQLLRRIHVIKEFKKENPQTPQGGLNRGININSLDLITPPRIHYPVRPRSPPPPPIRSYARSPLKPLSPTQEWFHPDYA